MNTKAVSVPEATALSSAFTFDQLKQLARSVAASKLFGVKTEDEALSLLVISQAEGRHPALAVRDYHIISGRPSLKADTMLARFQAAGGKVDWKKYTETVCEGVFSHPQAGAVTVEWTIERAKQIGLTKNPAWSNYPRAMLRARCISEGVRTCFPGIAVGIYTPEEIEAGETEINVTPSKTDAAFEDAAQRSASALTQEEVEAHVNAMDVLTMAELEPVFSAAWTQANKARDKVARDRFQQAYELRKADIIAKPPAAAGKTI